MHQEGSNIGHGSDLVRTFFDFSETFPTFKTSKIFYVIFILLNS